MIGYIKRTPKAVSDMNYYKIIFICALVLSVGVVGQVLGAQSPLPDTGQVMHFTQTFGEDADYQGRGPALKDNGDGTITDLITGLMWQKKDGGEMTWEKAKDYAKKLNLGGYSDWRLPNSMELFSILNHGSHGPALDNNFFTRTKAEYWWTYVTRVDDATKVWVVNAGGGIGAHPKDETLSSGGEKIIDIRCVRNVSPFGLGPRLKDNGDGTILDEQTGLVWQQIGPSEPMTWEEALSYCSKLSLAKYQDWRLPNVKELRSLSDDLRVDPSIDRKYFKQIATASYWSSTSLVNNPIQAWFIDTETGLISHADKTEKFLLLAVRDGEVKEGSRQKPKVDMGRFNDQKKQRRQPRPDPSK
jgi:Protein of unknown function (DUF1566)